MNPDSQIVMTGFALRHFDASEHPPAIPGSPDDFIAAVNKYLRLFRISSVFRLLRIDPGYAPFCKIMYFENWTDAKAGIVSITDDNRSRIKSEYEARHEGELPVLVRFIELTGAELPTAKYLAVIVYDKEQMEKEGTPINGDYAVVNILRLSHMTEPPMPPITMMRNALGVNEGGSGVPLDRKAYLQSVEYWSRHVSVKPTERKQA